MENRLDFKFDGFYLLLFVPALAGFFFPALAFVGVALMPFLVYALMLRRGVLISAAFLFLTYALLAFRHSYPLLLAAGVLGYFAFSLLAMVIDMKAGRPFHVRLVLHFSALLAGLVCFAPFFQSIAASLPALLRDMVAASKSGDELLLQLWQQGVAGMDTALLKAQQAYGGAVLLPEVRLELLNSFQTTLTLLLPRALPEAVALFTGIGAMAMAMIPVVFLRQRGHPVKSPKAFERWRLDGFLRQLLIGLLPGFLFRFITDNTVMLLMGSMMATLAKVMLVTQGLAVIAHGQKARGTGRLLRRVWSVLMAVFLYQVPLMFGAADQFIDFRGLRPKNKEEAE